MLVDADMKFWRNFGTTSCTMRIGVLALQGAFIEHIVALEQLGVEARQVRTVDDLVMSFLSPVALTQLTTERPRWTHSSWRREHNHGTAG